MLAEEQEPVDVVAGSRGTDGHGNLIAEDRNFVLSKRRNGNGWCVMLQTLSAAVVRQFLLSVGRKL